MNRRTGRHPWDFARRIVLTALGGATLLCSGAGVARAQVGEGAASSDSVGVDYFARGSDPRAAARVQTVETHHLGENNFWKRYREGDFKWAFEDLIFILRYVPNHPKALYLIAFDKNLNKDASLIIQHFERAIRLHPRSAYTYAQYGRYLSSLGQQTVGIALLDEAIRLDPKLIAARAWREAAQKARPESDPARSGDTSADRGPATSSEKPSQDNR